MSYAGIVKGLAGIGSAMVVAATRAGAADALRDELALSQPAILARLEVALPDMLPKAYRWVAEMREISGFLGPDHPASQRRLGGKRHGVRDGGLGSLLPVVAPFLFGQVEFAVDQRVPLAAGVC